MFETILQTKLHIPAPVAEVVPRPRLVKMLNDGLRGKLTLVLAPAGFGKTTLVTTWLAQLPEPYHMAVAWLSLDEADNDLGRFWNYFCAALQKANIPLSDSTLGMLQLGQLPEVPKLVTPLLNDLHQQTAVLVLDDFHVIHDVIVQQALNFFIEHQPPHIHLVITSRQEPPLPLSRLRARRQMTEVTAPALRFDTAETAALLSNELGRALAPTEITQLAKRTEGWAAGLHLAALSLKNSSDPQAFIASFAGTNRYVLDYLLDEVFEMQPAAVQTFLLQTSILERFTASLCEALTEFNTAAKQLAYIENHNLFLIPLDNERQWYRYHHLFADLLRHRLEEKSPMAAASLHQKASHWYKKHNFLDEAIHHALAGQDYNHAAELIEQTAMRTLWNGGQASALVRQIEAIPVAIRDAYPRLYMGLAWAHLIMGHIDRVTDCLAAAEQTAAYQEDESLRQAIQSTALDVKAILARASGQAEESMRLSREALAHVSPENKQLRAILHLGLGAAYNMLGDLDAAARSASEVLELTEEVESAFITLQALVGWGGILYRQLQLNRAMEIYQQALAVVRENRLTHSPAAGLVYVALGELFYDRHQMEEAEAYFQQAAQLAEPAGLVDVMLPAYLGLSHVHVSRRNYEQAFSYAQRLQALVPKDHMPWIQAELENYLAGVQLAMGDYQALAEWEKRRQLSVSNSQIELDIFRYMLWFHYHLRLAAESGNVSKLSGLQSYADTLIVQAEEKRLVLRMTVLYFYKAMFHECLGERKEALAAAEKSLALARPQNYKRCFLDKKELAIPVLTAALQAQIEPEFVQTLLEALAAMGYEAETADDVQTANESLTEPLTERELEILQLLAEGLSTKQTAARLFLSPGTVKWHTNNIYSKLGVSNRVAALNSAQELGILT